MVGPCKQEKRGSFSYSSPKMGVRVRRKAYDLVAVPSTKLAGQTQR